MNNLSLLRNAVDVPCGSFSKLLNTTAHTYSAYEKGKMELPSDILKLISLIYQVSEEELLIDKVKQNTIDRLSKISTLSIDEKMKVLSFNLFGKNIKPTYRAVKKLKNELK